MTLTSQEWEAIYSVAKIQVEDAEKDVKQGEAELAGPKSVHDQDSIELALNQSKERLKLWKGILAKAQIGLIRS